MNILYIWDKGASTANTISNITSGFIGKQTFDDPTCPITHYDSSTDDFDGTNINPSKDLSKMHLVIHFNCCQCPESGLQSSGRRLQ